MNKDSRDIKAEIQSLYDKIKMIEYTIGKLTRKKEEIFNEIKKLKQETK